jgi:hypothetical protein
VDLSKLSPGEKIVLIAGGVLLIDLLFLPWYDIDLGFVSVTRSAIESPKAFWGVLAALVTAAMVAAVVVTRFTTAKMPALPVPLGQAMFFGGVAVAVFLLLKLLLETDFLGIGAWLGILLGGAVAYGGFLMRNESRGVAPPTTF